MTKDVRRLKVPETGCWGLWC